MKLILTILKWIGKIMTGLLILVLLAGLCFRIFDSKPIPPGKLVDINGTKLHVRVEGERNNYPTIILEAGANSSTDMFHWVSKGLNKKFRVILYDREGKWFSESTKDSIHPEFYAKQLHDLLDKINEKPPYILVGHSMGGPYNRIFRDVYPDEVLGMVFLDSSHPEQWKRLAQKELVPKSQLGLIKVGTVLADLGIIGLLNTINNSSFRNDGLPKECHIRSRKLTSHSGQVYRRYLKENDINKDILHRAGRSSQLDSLPILVFTATEQYRETQKEKYRKQGIDPEQQIQIWMEMQREMKELSSNGKQFILNGNHGEIITQKENADKINQEILLMIKSILD
ncbi:alpha/beta hydrolase [Tenacibaculum sp. 190524A05c]|uniref:alpha/beta fold hydrolase n=1 Tax=Tenacibaculum platacis TaxID=3137852 RepID=UPI0032B2BD8C